ncbi:MAG: PA2169 family four-helix-bundle protein [Flavobacteriales bacterium]|nr:PA2169 family four-helix-bundle protein [Flavobacteriales bacterium]
MEPTTPEPLANRNKPAYAGALNDLHDLLEDSRKGYHEAAERAEDPAVKLMLDGFARERMPLITALVTERLRLDPSYEPSNGTIKGDLHRAWMDIRDTLSSTDNANVLSECERGEKYLLDRYDDVLKLESLPVETGNLLRSQRAKVHENLNVVRERRRAKEAHE